MVIYVFFLLPLTQKIHLFQNLIKKIYINTIRIKIFVIIAIIIHIGICLFKLLICEGRQYIKDVLVDGQSHLLIIREETELPGAQVSEV